MNVSLFCFFLQTLKGIHNFRASGDYDNDCTNPIPPLCTQPDQVIKGKQLFSRVPYKICCYQQKRQIFKTGSSFQVLDTRISTKTKTTCLSSIQHQLQLKQCLNLGAIQALRKTVKPKNSHTCRVIQFNVMLEKKEKKISLQ